MICPMCKGGRKVLKKEKGDMGYIVRLAICDKCNGTGEIKETNEEWFVGLSTEEKAEWLYYHSGAMSSKGDWEDWLKEKHE